MAGFDWSVLYFIHNGMKCDFLDAVLPFFSYICEYGAVWIAVGIAMAAVKRYRRNGIVLLLGLLAGVLVCNVVLKNLVVRPRPFWIDESVISAVKEWNDYSFPSGHATACAIAAVIIFKTNKRWGIAAIAVTVLVCLSRLYFFMHFPTDVLGGVVIGILIGELIWLAAGKTGFLPDGGEKK